MEDLIKELIVKYREDRRKLRIQRDATKMTILSHNLDGQVDKLTDVISDLVRLL